MVHKLILFNMIAHWPVVLMVRGCRA